MRFAWLLLLLAALLPERFGSSGNDGDCCAESCACGAAEVPSCCATTEGPVIVALCGCGEPHTPRLIERIPVDWFGGLPLPGPVSQAQTGRLDELPTRALVGLTPAPEPPPPRFLV